METSTQLKPNYLLAELADEFDHERLQKFFVEILRDCKLSGRTRILIDWSKVTGDMLATHRAIAGLAGVEAYRKYFGTRQGKLKIAIVGREWFLKGQPPPYTPTTNALRDAGIDVLLTHIHSKAIDWLDQ